VDGLNPIYIGYLFCKIELGEKKDIGSE
jgi:hypothetical protein